MTTLTREDIQKSAKTSVAEYRADALDRQPGLGAEDFRRRLRLGRFRHLAARPGRSIRPWCCSNGRRIAPYGLADDGQKVFADLNLIPLDAVERIEILKDGASAIYGSDAIAGVVNVILRRDYQGLSANVSFGTSEYWNAKEKRASLTGGFGDLQTQGFNVLANFEVGRQGEAYYRDITDRRQVGRTDLRGYGFDAETAAGTALSRRRQVRSTPAAPAVAVQSTATSVIRSRSFTSIAATSIR